MDVVRVGLEERGYNIHIGSGLLERAGEFLNGFSFGSKAMIVVDETVNSLYAGTVIQSLLSAGFQPVVAVLAPGENTKSLTSANELFTQAIENGLDRRSPIIALGGGVVGDLAGFVAATYLRGVPFIQIPTTLLAQVDSSVGGKVAINHALGKNLIGAFYQPRVVLIDTDTICTLPEREVRAGLAEVIKYGIIADPAFFAFLEKNCQAILGKDSAVLKAVIRRCCEIKADVVERDERESNIRMILNFGHTIGHAIEASADYSRYNHGEAVAIGMYGAALLSARLGRCSKDEAEAVRALIERYGLPVLARDCAPDCLCEFLARDKKSVDGRVNWVLMTKIGQTEISDQVPDSAIRQVLGYIT